jgi:NAD(P)-dependent dehydrogenase (short-subunit alcohol dehydrogenase family)
MTKTIFITGTSSGLGKLTAFHFAKRGWNAKDAEPVAPADHHRCGDLKGFGLSRLPE